LKPLKLNIIWLLLLTVVMRANADFGNEWIEYNLSYYKIKVTKAGLHRVGHGTLSNLPFASFNGAQISRINLFNKGKVVPVYVYDSNGNGLFDNDSEFIEFYGKPNDGTFDSNLYADPQRQHPNPYVSMFNDTAIYFLTVNTERPSIPITSVPNDLSNLPVKETYFMHSVLIAGRDFQPGRSYIVGGKPTYECIFDEGEGFAEKVASAYTIVCPQIYASAPVSAHLSTSIVTNNQTQQTISLKINSYEILSDTIYGTALVKYSRDFPVSQLINYNSFYVNGTSTRALAYAEFSYPREFTFPNESKTYFALNAGAGARYLEISAFNDNGTAPILYDITNKLRIVGSPAQGTGRHRFKLPAQQFNVKRELFLTAQSANDIINVIITPNDRVDFVNYNNSSFQGDYVILTHPKLLDDGNGNNYVSEYAKYRNSFEGGGHQAEIVLIDQLYDQFAYGIKKHPLAIRNFIDFALARWNVKPEHLFIIGKGREYVYSATDPPGSYDKLKNNSLMYAQCLVPTFGHPGSDPLLTATTASIVPRVAVGRLSVENASEINVYLEKVKAYERKQREAGDPYQSIEEKLWMKRILHMGGGEDASQQNLFKAFLKNYETIIEDTLFGGTVYNFYKTSTAPIQIVQSDFLRELINTGVSLITFFGHSSPNSFDIAIDDPSTFTNYEKYHLILSNGCFTGNIYNPIKGISEDFVLVPDKGAIGFISTITFSSSDALNIYTNNFYKNLGKNYYGSTIGTVMQKSIADVEANFGGAVNRTIAEEMTLHGDPGVSLNPHDRPDYALEPQMVSFLPSNVNIEDDSFKLKVIVTNLGRAVKDSVNLIVTRFLPDVNDGSVSYVKRMRGTYFSDTVIFNIPTGSTKAFGINNFYIKIDSGNEVAELSETNNELGSIPLNIASEDIFPIHPYEFAIVPQQPVTLKASTANVFAPMNTYRIEIDTTELFNSPLKDSVIITQSGGVVTWTPSIQYMDSTVYYWRTGVEGKGTFHTSSFIYLDGEYPGWNQSHYFQFLKDDFSNIYLDNDRVFKFIGDVKTVTVKTGTADISGGTVPWDQIAHHVNQALKHRWVCGGEGFRYGLVLAVFDSASGNNWISKYSDVAPGHPCSGVNWNTVHGNVHCKQRDLHGFDFPTENSCYMDKIVDFINSVPDGNYILAYSVNSAYYNSWSQTLIDAFVNLGSQLLPGMTCCSNIPWAFFAQKGHPETATELRGNGMADVLNFTATFTAHWNQGTITTPPIGPAYEWGSVHWKYHALESSTDDEQIIDIIGITPSGSETVIYSGLHALDTSIQFISAAMYPYIKLRLDTRDDPARTPSQLEYWRVLYKKVPEAALSPNIHISFHGDTLTLGENLSLSVACENVTPVPMDSLLVKYTLLSTGYPPVNEYVRYDSLRALQTMNLQWTFNTECNCLGELNSLIIEVNPVPPYSSGKEYDQPEQFHFNNIGVLNFKMDRDKINPLLDVTFDGVHIMDGDIVSAEPEILIRLKDENRFLLLNDTSLLNIFILDEEGNQTKMHYDGIIMQFFPAGSGSNNTAEVVLKKEFEENGTYTLLVQARDRSRNISGTYGLPNEGIDYRISFEVVREAMITNVLNYPNPFTSSTRFVFTLTGIRPPDFFKIQIMTVSGKVVRELTQYDLGPLHIGRNITEYAWDGTDEYGDPLGNGIYLYRVFASIDGQPIEKWKEGPDKNADKYFKSGFGKMYLAR